MTECTRRHAPPPSSRSLAHLWPLPAVSLPDHLPGPPHSPLFLKLKCDHITDLPSASFFLGNNIQRPPSAVHSPVVWPLPDFRGLSMLCSPAPLQCGPGQTCTPPHTPLDPSPPCMPLLHSVSVAPSVWGGMSSFVPMILAGQMSSFP